MLSFAKDGVKQYYHTDHLGSIRKLTNVLGSVTESSTYLAFGSPTTQDSGRTTRYGFTGREDESDFGLMYYRARYYDPSIGRFISPDPFTRGPDDPRVSYSNNWYSKIHGEATLYAEWLNPHNFNRYVYCNNNPVCYIDPLGQNWLDWVQGGLDAAGVLDPTPTCDAVSGLISLGRGNVKDAGWSAISMVPYVGDVVGKTGKYGSKILKYVGKAEKAAEATGKLSPQVQKGIRTLEKRIAEHQAKLANFKKNPTIRPGMENLSEEVIKKQQQDRIQHLENEIQTFKNNIKKLRNGGQ